jgi:uncharacterized membrane protein
LSSLESSKNLASIGAIFLILSLIPVIGVFIGFAGVILLLIGIKGVSEYYQDISIYRNALGGVIFFIIGLLTSAVVGVTIYTYLRAVPPITALLNNLILIIALLIGLFIFYLLTALCFRRAFRTLTQKTGNHLFETSSLLLFIGAILTILIVGIALIIIAWIIAAVAFFSIKKPT